MNFNFTNIRNPTSANNSQNRNNQNSIVNPFSANSMVRGQVPNQNTIIFPSLNSPQQNAQNNQSNWISLQPNIARIDVNTNPLSSLGFQQNNTNNTGNNNNNQLTIINPSANTQNLFTNLVQQTTHNNYGSTNSISNPFLNINQQQRQENNFTINNSRPQTTANSTILMQNASNPNAVMNVRFQQNNNNATNNGNNSNNQNSFISPFTNTQISPFTNLVHQTIPNDLRSLLPNTQQVNPNQINSNSNQFMNVAHQQVQQNNSQTNANVSNSLGFNLVQTNNQNSMANLNISTQNNLNSNNPLTTMVLQNLFKTNENHSNALQNANQQQTVLSPSANNLTPQQDKSQLDRLIESIKNPDIFKDERDLVIAKWNRLLASYGIGKFYHQNNGFDVPKDNPFASFKANSYVKKSRYENEDGFVCLVINQPIDVVNSYRHNVIECLKYLFQSDPTITIVLETTKQIIPDRTEVLFYVILNNSKNRLSSKRVFEYLFKTYLAQCSDNSRNHQIHIENTLKQIDVLDVYPLLNLNKQDEKDYLNRLPKVNKPPFSQQYLHEKNMENLKNSTDVSPIQIRSFQDLYKKNMQNVEQVQTQATTLQSISTKISSANDKRRILEAKIENFKAKNEDLEHRVLKIMLNFTIRQRARLTFQADEKRLRDTLESFNNEYETEIYKQLRSKGLNRFSELNELVDVYASDNANKQTANQQNLNSNSIESLKGSISEINNSFKSLITTIKTDLNDLNLIKNSLKK